MGLEELIKRTQTELDNVKYYSGTLEVALHLEELLHALTEAKDEIEDNKEIWHDEGRMDGWDECKKQCITIVLDARNKTRPDMVKEMEGLEI